MKNKFDAAKRPRSRLAYDRRGLSVRRAEATMGSRKAASGCAQARADHLRRAADGSSQRGGSRHVPGRDPQPSRWGPRLPPPEALHAQNEGISTSVRANDHRGVTTIGARNAGMLMPRRRDGITSSTTAPGRNDSEGGGGQHWAATWGGGLSFQEPAGSPGERAHSASRAYDFVTWPSFRAAKNGGPSSCGRLAKSPASGGGRRLRRRVLRHSVDSGEARSGCRIRTPRTAGVAAGVRHGDSQKSGFFFFRGGAEHQRRPNPLEPGL